MEQPVCMSVCHNFIAECKLHWLFLESKMTAIDSVVYIEKVVLALKLRVHFSRVSLGQAAVQTRPCELGVRQ